MRRRLREQRRMREALLLDLGALVFELQRQGRREPELLQAKAAELRAVDQEVRALAHALDVGQGVGELVATGVAGSCENCGSLLSTDARYCAACGSPAVPSLGREARDAGPALSPPRAPEPPAFADAGRAEPAAFPEGRRSEPFPESRRSEPPAFAEGGRSDAPAFSEGGRSGFHSPGLSGSGQDPADGHDPPEGRLGRMRGLVRRRNPDG